MAEVYVVHNPETAITAFTGEWRWLSNFGTGGCHHARRCALPVS